MHGCFRRFGPLVALCVASPLLGAGPRDGVPPASPHAAAAASTRSQITDAPSLLAALETADRGLRTLTARVQYARTFGELQGGDRQTWRGRLAYVADLGPTAEDPEPPEGQSMPPRRGFAVEFDTLLVDNQVRTERKRIAFDGRWLAEFLPEEHQVTRQRVALPGERADPLRIGEGPFPIPIGQKKDDLLARFEATLPASEDGFGGALPASLKDTWQLRLVPKPGTEEAEQFREIRLWYRKADLLPRLARAVHEDGAASEILLIDLKRNEIVDASMFNTLPPGGEVWEVSEREFRRPLAGAPPLPEPAGEAPPTPEPGSGAVPK